MGNGFIAVLVGIGAAIWVYRYFSKRATGNDFVKTVTPAVIAGVIAFAVTLTLLLTVVPA